MKKLNRGFTLIELLVVIAIIAVLTGLIIVNIYSSRGKARDAKRISDVAQIELGLEQYFDKNQVYPNTLNGLVPTYISVIPVDPLSHNSYDYHPSGTYLDYIVHTVLEYPGNNATNDSLSQDPFGTNGSGSGASTCAPLTINYCVGPR